MKNKTDLPLKEGKESLSEYFSSDTKFWKKVYQDDSDVWVFYQFDMNTRRNAAIRYINDTFTQNTDKRLRILDIGSGPGTMIDSSFKDRYAITCLDLSSEMIRNAQLKALESEVYVSCVRGDAESLPFNNSEFHVVTALGLMEYVPDQNAVIKEIRRVLKPGGISILSFPNGLKTGNIFDPYFLFIRMPRYVYSKIMKRESVAGTKKDLYSSNKHFSNRRYILRKLKRWLEEMAFEIKDVTSIGYGPLTILRYEFLPKRMSFWISSNLTHRKTTESGGWLAHIANRWILLLRKK